MKGHFPTALVTVLSSIITGFSAETPLTIENIQCQPEALKNNQGRYTCNQSGEVLCNRGWSGEGELLCQIPLCLFGVDGEALEEDKCGPNGECVAPDVCSCQIGWEGLQCGICIPMPGCLHGSCQKAFECDNCESGWKGPLCDQPDCGTCVHGECVTSDMCKCEVGWTGEMCDQCVDLPGCSHGGCSKDNTAIPYGCQCDSGWAGPLCDCPICKEGCNLEHGYCTNPDECDCYFGWKGDTCDECVTHPSCPEDATCTKPWGCNCKIDHDDNRYCTIRDNTIGDFGYGTHFFQRMSQACINYNRNPPIKAGIGGVDSSLLPGNLLQGLNDSHGIPGGPKITPGFPISVDGILNKSDGTSEPKEAPGSQDDGISGSVETTSTESNLANGGNCAGACAFNYDPVCGSDGQTYSNECFLEMENCRDTHIKISVAYSGECNEKTTQGRKVTINKTTTETRTPTTDRQQSTSTVSSTDVPPDYGEIGKLFPGRDGGGILDSLVRSLGVDSRYGIPSMDLANVGEFDGFDDLTFGSEGGGRSASNIDVHGLGLPEDSGPAIDNLIHALQPGWKPHDGLSSLTVNFPSDQFSSKKGGLRKKRTVKRILGLRKP